MMTEFRAIALVAALLQFMACASAEARRVPSSRVPASTDLTVAEDSDFYLDDKEDAANVKDAKSLNPFGHTRFRGLHVNGADSPHFDLIQKAKKTLDIEIYEMQDVDFRQALRDAMKRGVRVRVVKDPTPLGERCNVFKADTEDDKADCREQRSLVAEVIKNQGAYVAFNKAELCGIPGRSCYEHGKIIIVDGKIALISTGNFNSSNLCNARQDPKTCNRDYSFITRRRPLVNALTKVFEKDLIGTRYDVKQVLAPSDFKLLTVSPYSLQPLIDFINTAKESVEIENQYLKEPTFNEALIKVAKSGVKVKITLSSACAFGAPTRSAADSLKALYSSFDAAGIDTRMFTSQVKVDGHSGYMHAKSIVVDGKYAWVGSVNGSSTSMNQNREYGLFFKQRRNVKLLLSTMRSDHDEPGTESWDESLRCVKDHGSSPDGE